MVNKCCAIGCRSGFKSNKNPVPNITFHRFPSNPKFVKLWLTNLGRPDYVPTKYSGLCSLHFKENDFLRDRTDTNVSRIAKQSKTLVNRRLKPDAIPEPHRKVPKYRQIQLTKPRSGKSTFEGRRLIIAAYQRKIEEEMKRKEAVASVEQIIEKLKIEKYPQGFEYWKKDSSLVFVKSHIDDLNMPIIDASIVIKDHLQVFIFVHGKPVPRSKFSCIVSNFVNCFTQVRNLLSLVLSWVENPAKLSWIDLSISCLDEAITGNDDENLVHKLKFNREQLELTKRHGAANRYSQDLHAFAMGIRKISRQVLLSKNLRKYISLPCDHGVRNNICKTVRVENGTEEAYRATLKAQ